MSKNRTATSSSSSTSSTKSTKKIEPNKKTIITNKKDLTNSLLSLLSNKNTREVKKDKEVLKPSSVFTFESPFSKLESDQDDNEDEEEYQNNTENNNNKTYEESDKDSDILDLLNSNKKINNPHQRVESRRADASTSNNVKEPIEYNNNKKELEEIKKEINEIKENIKEINATIGNMNEMMKTTNNKNTIGNNEEEFLEKIKFEIATNVGEKVVPGLVKVSEELIKQTMDIIETKLNGILVNKKEEGNTPRGDIVDSEEDNSTNDFLVLNKNIEKRDFKLIVENIARMNNLALSRLVEMFYRMEQRKLLALAKLMSRELSVNTHLKSVLIVNSLRNLKPKDDSIGQHVDIFLSSINGNISAFLSNENKRRRSPSNNESFTNLQLALSIIQDIKNDIKD